MFDEFCAEIPKPLVESMLKPLIVIQLLLEIAKPFVPPLRRTDAPGAAVNTIGAAAVAEVGTVTDSEYVPDAT